MIKTDVIIIGAGAAGLMCAIEAGKRGRQVLVLDHANKPGKKILMSGGGRCNFTNYHVSAENFISHNSHFCKSALSRYTPSDFIALVKKYKISFHEKTLGQLFCDYKSKDILDLLLQECRLSNVTVRLNTVVEKIENPHPQHFKIKTLEAVYDCHSLVIATGGLSIPTMGASPFGYKVAEQFNIPVWPTRPALVPLTLHVEEKEKYSPLSGIAINCVVTSSQKSFRENMLFTHRGLSGPAILQISSYWEPGEKIIINLLPDVDLHGILNQHRGSSDKQLKTVLNDHLPKRVIEIFFSTDLLEKKLKTFSQKEIIFVCDALQSWCVKPNGTEGYRTAEVTLGGVDCNKLSSKTMEVLHVPGLYFIGEVLDVTGWLGGYNFQWAWSSGWAAGQVV